MSICWSRRHLEGPIAAFAPGFAQELRRQGYTPYSVGAQTRLLAVLSGWLLQQGLTEKDLHKCEIDRFLDARRTAVYAPYLSKHSIRPILDYLRGLGALPPPMADVIVGPVAEMLERFRRYLLVERVLALTTVDAHVRAVRPFLQGRLSSDGSTLRLSDLSGSEVISFVTTRCPAQTHGAAKQTVKALRSLLRFLHLDGVIKRSLVSAVPSIASRRLTGLPKALSPEQVRRLLAACDARTRTGCRDKAILMLLVRLGLRAGEVARLQLDDVDWRGGEIVVRGKGHCIERLPLPPDVGRAVAAYVRRVRPASAQGRTVFVRRHAPHGALGCSGVSCVVACAARRAGLGLIHAHRLRHTAATAMLRAGASLPEIGQVLRHRCLMSTAIYAKVDREALRTIARLWPGDAP
jgi:site-specific recombinase XerD